MKKTMFAGAKPEIFDNAKKLRHNQTPAEELLWSKLSNNQLRGFRFRRQHPIGNFIVDFYCHKAQLVVEVDGSIHQLPEQKENDKHKTAELEDLGLLVLRFKNYEIFSNLIDVLEKIEKYLPPTL